MKRSTYVIIGLGSIGKELLGKISRDVDVVCIDRDAEQEDAVKEIREDSLFFAGDATSRLVLEEAGVADADGVIIATTTEKVTIETARILRDHFETKRVIALGTTSTGIDSLQQLGVEVESIFTASAVAIRNRIAQASRAAHAIGLGKEEILEVDVHPHSRLANRPLYTLSHQRWRIGLIYRDENIIVPKRDAVLRPRDRVVILGEPSVLKTVSEMLTFKFERFPLEYGSTAVTYLTGTETEDFFDELDYLFSIFPLDRMIFIYSDRAARKEDTFEEFMKKENIKNPEARRSSLAALPAIEETVGAVRGDQGIIVLSKDMVTSPSIRPLMNMKSKHYLRSLLQNFRCPLILTAGTFPYERACIPCVEHLNIQHIMETSLEITTSLHNELSALLVNPSKYISSHDDVDEFQAMKKTIDDVSSMYRISIEKSILEGNPVTSVASALSEFNLLITGIEGEKNRKWVPSFLNPDVGWSIVRRSPISTLLLPVLEEIL